MERWVAARDSLHEIEGALSRVARLLATMGQADDRALAEIAQEVERAPSLIARLREAREEVVRARETWRRVAGGAA